MKITEDFIGNETKELTKTKIATILRWWGFNPDSYSTWGNARVDMNNILSGSSSSTISDRERASSFLSKINYINDTDTVISDTLFAANEPGVWYDPSDLSTLYQDAVGTTPVTAVEQPVGLMLDKSKGLVLGPELVPQPLNVSTTPWSATSAVTSRTQNSFTTSDIGGIILEGLSATKTYEIRIAGTTSSPLLVRNPGTLDGYYVIPEGAFDVTIRSPAMFSSDSSLYLSLGEAGTATIDNISVREIPGNHAYQTTATSRPVLSARVNLLTKTQQFDDGYWNKNNVSITANIAATADPLGANTADKLIPNNGVTMGFPSSQTPLNSPVTVTKGLTYIGSIYAKKAEFDRLSLFFTDGVAGSEVVYDLNAGTVVSGAGTIRSVGDGWHLCSFSRSASANHGGAPAALSALRISAKDSVATVGDGTSGIYIWGADLRVANDGANLPPYQRVNTATDYDTAGFPHYLRFDGVDDWMVTPTITPGTDKAQVFAGVRKLSDGAIGVVAETSINWYLNNGSIAIAAPNTASANYGFNSRGSVSVIGTSSNSFSAPLTSVLSGQAEISGDSLMLRVNGSLSFALTSNQGAGNYLAYPLYIGRRGGTTFPFNGHLYSLIVRFGSNLPAATIENTEKYINGLTKAY